RPFRQYPHAHSQELVRAAGGNHGFYPIVTASRTFLPDPHLSDGQRQIVVYNDQAPAGRLKTLKKPWQHGPGKVHERLRRDENGGIPSDLEFIRYQRRTALLANSNPEPARHFRQYSKSNVVVRVRVFRPGIAKSQN